MLATHANDIDRMNTCMPHPTIILTHLDEISMLILSVQQTPMFVDQTYAQANQRPRPQQRPTFQDQARRVVLLKIKERIKSIKSAKDTQKRSPLPGRRAWSGRDRPPVISPRQTSAGLPGQPHPRAHQDSTAPPNCDASHLSVRCRAPK
jgi:hypothetical protein